MAIQKPDPLPDATVPPQIAPGVWHPDWYRWFRFIDRVIRETVDFANTPEPPPPEIEFPEQWPYGVAFVEDGDYVIVQNNDVERTIYETVSDCDAGTCTVTFKINSTAISGATHSVSTTESVISRSPSDVLAVGDDLIATVSGNSSCEKMRLNVKTTRAIVIS